MHDLGYFRANFDAVAARLATRSNPPSLDTFRDLDARRRAAIRESEELKARRNSESQEIAGLRKQGVDTSEKQAAVREVGDRVAALDEQVRSLDKEFQDLLAGIPNLPHESVPVGRGAEDNVEVRRCGAPRTFDFTPKPHWELGPELGILDMERAAKITGARFAVYWGMGAKLERALWNFMLDTHTREHGYTEVLPPFLVNSASLYGTGQIARSLPRICSSAKAPTLWLYPYGRGSGHQPVSRRDPRRRPASDFTCAPSPPAFSQRDRILQLDATCAGSSGSISFRKWSW